MTARWKRAGLDYWDKLEIYFYKFGGFHVSDEGQTLSTFLNSLKVYSDVDLSTDRGPLFSLSDVKTRVYLGLYARTS